MQVAYSIVLKTAAAPEPLIAEHASNNVVYECAISINGANTRGVPLLVDVHLAGRSVAPV